MIRRRDILKTWITPVVLSVSLPAHAQNSPCCDGVGRALSVSASDQSCNSEVSTNIVNFTLCNSDTDTINVFSVESGGTVMISSITPMIPFSIPMGGCINVQMEVDSCPVGTSIGFSGALEDFSASGEFTVEFS